MNKRTYNRKLSKLKAKQGSRTMPDNPRGLTREDRRQRSHLRIKGKGYLVQDGGRGVSIKVLALKCTRNNPKKPFEHLTLRRIEDIVPKFRD